MSIEFHCVEKLTKYGPIVDPRITILVKKGDSYHPLTFLFDSGADITMLPYPIAELLNIDLKSSAIDYTYGINENPVKVYVNQITIKIGNDIFPIRCFFSSNKRAPLLLGRVDIWGKYNIIFNNAKKRLILSSYR